MAVHRVGVLSLFGKYNIMFSSLVKVKKRKKKKLKKRLLKDQCLLDNS